MIKIYLLLKIGLYNSVVLGLFRPIVSLLWFVDINGLMMYKAFLLRK